MATEEEIEAAQRQNKLDKIKREGTINAINDYVKYIVGRLAGITGVTWGALEMLSPDIIPYDTQKPEVWASVGLTLLTGKSVIKVVDRVLTSLYKSKDLKEE